MTFFFFFNFSSQNDEGGTLRDRLEDLRLKLQDVINLVMESNNQIAVAKAHGEEGKKNVDKAKTVIERARESLKVKTFFAKIKHSKWILQVMWLVLTNQSAFLYNITMQCLKLFMTLIAGIGGNDCIRWNSFPTNNK